MEKRTKLLQKVTRLRVRGRKDADLRYKFDKKQRQTINIWGNPFNFSLLLVLVL